MATHKLQELAAVQMYSARVSGREGPRAAIIDVPVTRPSVAVAVHKRLLLVSCSVSVVVIQ